MRLTIDTAAVAHAVRRLWWRHVVNRTRQRWMGRCEQLDAALHAELPICADTGTHKDPYFCWNVRCQLGRTCCRADGGARAAFFCNRCGYSGPVQTGHQRPNGTGECNYMAVPVTHGAEDSLLRQCHLSGQMSAAQAVHHAAAGELSHDGRNGPHPVYGLNGDRDAS